MMSTKCCRTERQEAKLASVEIVQKGVPSKAERGSVETRGAR